MKLEEAYSIALERDKCLREGKIGKALALGAMLLFGGLMQSCSMETSIEDVPSGYEYVDTLNNIEDEDVRYCVKNYFSTSEQKSILSVLAQETTARAVLGTTHCGFTKDGDCVYCYMDFDDNAIESQREEVVSNTDFITDISSECFRRMTVIHELCHVLHDAEDGTSATSNGGHTTAWLNTFSEKLTEYVQDSIDDGSIELGEVNGKTNASLVLAYIVNWKTSSYK